MCTTTTEPSARGIMGKECANRLIIGISAGRTRSARRERLTVRCGVVDDVMNVPAYMMLTM